MGSPEIPRVVVVSAHEGATTWSRMCEHIRQGSRYDVVSFHEFDDATYRGMRTPWQRLRLRLRTFVVFPLRFLVSGRRAWREGDLAIVVTSPFYMPIVAALAMPRRARRAIALMNDIYPEALVAKGVLRRNGFIERGMKRLFGRALSRMAATVFITRHHLDFVKRDVSLPARALVIPVSAHSEPFAQVDFAAPVERVRITYCGTLGLMHDTATFLGWLDSRVAAPVSFAFHTSGASKQSLEVAVRERAATRPLGVEVLLGNALDEADWIRVMRETQVGLVLQDAGSGKVIFPSKMASILAAGQAVLAVADFDSEVARLVLDHDCGWVVAPGDTQGFQRAIDEMADAPTLRRKRANAHRLGRERFGNEGVARQWVALFDEIPGGNAP